MKKFMGAFAAIAAGFVAQNATAAINTADGRGPEAAAPASTETQTGNQLSIKSGSGDIFNFTLKRSPETGQLMAWHSSHASHASHGSHSSHYSSRY